MPHPREHGEKAGGERLGAPCPSRAQITHRFKENRCRNVRYVFGNVNRFHQWSGGRDATPRTRGHLTLPTDARPPRAALIIMGAILPGQRDRPTRA